MKNSLDEKSKLQRIKEISREIATLSAELERLLIEPPNSKELPTDTSIGDQVLITNNRANLRGQEATVVGNTSKRFILKLQTGQVIYRAKSNVQLVHHDRRTRKE